MEALGLNVLVLNKSYLPIRVVTAKTAFTKICNGLAEVVTVDNGYYQGYDLASWLELSALKQECGVESEDDWVATSSLRLAVPKVIRVLHYSKVRIKEVLLTRKNLFYRDNSVCQYCGKQFDVPELSIDHVTPRSKGGKDTWTNLVCACHKCNGKKGSRTPKEAGMKLIRKPVRPKFIPNFRMCISDKKYMIWKNFVSEVYWNAELE